MRYPASEKLEIIRLVEKSHLPVRRTLDKLGIPSTTFYRWYDRYQAFSEVGLEDRTSGPGRVWNRIPDNIRQRIVELALDEPELSPRELAVKFTDEKSYFVSEVSVYRLLKAPDLITSPAFIVVKAANLKNRVLLENYYLPGDLEGQIGAFVDHYNNHRYHESLGNVTPADTYFGRDTAIIERRNRIKKLTIQNRRLNHQRQAA